MDSTSRAMSSKLLISDDLLQLAMDTEQLTVKLFDIGHQEFTGGAAPRAWQLASSRRDSHESEYPIMADRQKGKTCPKCHERGPHGVCGSRLPVILPLEAASG